MLAFRTDISFLVQCSKSILASCRILHSLHGGTAATEKILKQLLITPRAYAQAGLSNRFCPSVVVVVCHTKFLKKPSNGRFRGYNNF